MNFPEREFSLILYFHNIQKISLKELWAIYKAQYFVPDSRINKLIYSWKRKTILMASLVDVGKIYAYHPFASVLLNQNKVGHLLWIT